MNSLCLEICSWSGIFLFQSLNYFNYDIGEGRESLKILIYLEQEYIYRPAGPQTLLKKRKYFQDPIITKIMFKKVNMNKFAGLSSSVSIFLVHIKFS